MKILVLTPGIYPDRHSGLPKLVYNISRELAYRNHEVIILTRKYSHKYSSYEIVENMHYFRVSIPKRGDLTHMLWPLVTAVQSYSAQKKMASQYENIDVVWVHNPWWMIGFNPKRWWPRAKIIYDFHSDVYSELLYNYPKNPVVQIIGHFFDRIAISVISKADLVLVHSEYARDRCISIGRNGVKDKIKIVPGGADEKLYTPITNNALKIKLRKELNLPLEQILFITARGLKPRTGVDKLVEALAGLKKKGVSFFIIIVGRGVMETKIRQYIDSLSLKDSVRLVSGISEIELAHYYQVADAFILPTQGAEGFGLATVEALLSGLVVLGTDNGATPEILKRYNKEWIINGCDPQSIGNKIEDFCRNRERYVMRAEDIRSITEKHYSWSISADRFLELMEGTTL